jgi:tRNA(fMet)-specific endonuclease VapC
MVCIDTNLLIALERGEKAALEKMQELDDRQEPIYASSITAAEYLYGAYGARDSNKALKDARDMISRFSILGFDYESADIWAELAHRLRTGTIGDRDLFIACIALANKQTLITRNKKHFERVPGLKVEGW